MGDIYFGSFDYRGIFFFHIEQGVRIKINVFG